MFTTFTSYTVRFSEQSAESEYSEDGECLSEYEVYFLSFEWALEVVLFVYPIEFEAVFSYRYDKSIISSECLYLVLFQEASEFARIHLRACIHLF